MIQCTVCASENLKKFRAKEWMFCEGREFTYEFCGDCRCIQLLMPQTDSAALYPKNYHSFSRNLFEFYSSPTGKEKLGRVKKSFWKTSGKIKDQPVLELLRDLKVNPSASITDIGCGTGELLYLLRELGYQNTIGFDPFLDESIRYRNGLQIKKLGIDAIQSKFDVIMLNHSFEHMTNPLLVLNQLRALLKDSRSRILIRVPVVNKAWNDFGEYWYQIDPPRHLHLFSPKGMLLILKQAHLEAEKTVFDSTVAQVFLSEKNFYRFNPKDISYYLKRIYKPVRRWSLQHQVERWNQNGLGDQAAFWIKPVENPKEIR